MNIKMFCRCSLFPSWSGYGLISTSVYIYKPPTKCTSLFVMYCINSFLSNTFRPLLRPSSEW